MRAKKQYFVLTKGVELFFHAAPNSTVMQAAMEKSRQQYPRATWLDQEAKSLDLMEERCFLPPVSNLEFPTSGPSWQNMIF